MSDRFPSVVRAADAPEPYRSAGPVSRVRVTRVGRAGRRRDDDLAAAEEPLEVRLHGRPFAVIMRTPGRDRELAAGFLLSEGVMRSHDDLGAVEHCRHPASPRGAQRRRRLPARRRGGALLDATSRQRRNVLTTSSCGLCGRVTIDSLRVLRVAARRRRSTATDDRAAAARPAARAAARCSTARAACTAPRSSLPTAPATASAEDVGRHNAVDKVIGAMLLGDRVPIAGRVLS